MNRRRRPRRVAVVTGTRADYGLLATAMEAIHDHRDLELQLIVTGMHLLRRFGRTVDDIERDGWRIDARIRMQRGTGADADQADGLARGVAGIAAFLHIRETDIVLVLGDRVEAMAGALAGTTTGRLVAHVHGGDLAPGDMDDAFRHAITKLAHLHLPATRQAARRIERMGEPSDRIAVVGAPGLDRLLKLRQRSGGRSVPGDRALIVHHPVGRSDEVEHRIMQGVLEAARRSGLMRTILYPNTDRGCNGVIDAIEQHRRDATNGGVEVHRSLDRDTYLKRLIEADLLLGNSSSGIIEAALAGTRAVNIGPRQVGRQRDRSAVIDAAENATAIRRAIDTARSRGPIRTRRSVYGDGQAGTRIASALAKAPSSEAFRRKLNRY